MLDYSIKEIRSAYTATAFRPEPGEPDTYTGDWIDVEFTVEHVSEDQLLRLRELIRVFCREEDN